MKKNPINFKNFLIALVLVWTLFPFYWMLVTSIKPNSELYNPRFNPFLVQKPTSEHFQYLLGETGFLTWFKNSLVVSLAATLITLVSSLLAAYSLSRLRFRGSSFWGMLVFIAYLVPPTLLFIPLSQVVSSLGLGDTLFALILTYPTFLVPFCTWMLMSYFSSIPFELEESALMDGASRFQILSRIILPLSLPAVVTVTLFSFTLSWGEMIYALSFISASFNKTLPVGIRSELVRGDVFYWGPLMGAALLASIPVIVIYSFLTDYYISGLTAGSVKY